MAKQRRPSRVQKKKPPAKPAAKSRRPAASGRTAAKARTAAPARAATPTRVAAPSRSGATVRTAAATAGQDGSKDRVKEAPAPPPRKPAYYEAIALYERGVQALQRHDFQTAAEHFRLVLERYPDERELVERARLYLRVCERETSRQPPAPKTPEELVYAATMSLNAGDHAAALDHLRKALDEDAESDHAHYIMAVALNMRGRQDEALDHLRQAVSLNPENRSLARQDPDLDGLRDHEAFRGVLDTPSDPARRRQRPRR